MPHPADPGIPTLTQRAEPCVASPETTQRAHPVEDFPILTDVAPHVGEDSTAASVENASAAHPIASAALNGSDPTLTVFRAALQAELEQALHHAVDAAAADMRRRLEAELPTLIERALNQVRPG